MMDWETISRFIKITEMLTVDFIILLLVLLLFYSQHISDLEKREWCYMYLQYDYCVCQTDMDLLLNRSLKINPYDARSIFSEEKIKEIAYDIKNK